MKSSLLPIFVRLSATGLLFTLVIAQSGCVAVVAGAGAGGAVAYVRGDLDTTLGASLSQSIRAANLAVEELQFVKVSETKDAVQATIIARDAADKKIEFYLSSLSEGATSLKIRVGTFGEDELQARILAQIRSHL